MGGGSDRCLRTRLTMRGACLLHYAMRCPPASWSYFDVPKANSAAVALAVSAGMTRVFETVRMYHGPPTPVERVFGLTTLEIG